MAGLVFLSMSPESEVTGFAAILILTPTRRFRDASMSSQGHRTRFLQELTGIETYLIWQFDKRFPSFVRHSFIRIAQWRGLLERQDRVQKSHSRSLPSWSLPKKTVVSIY